MRSAIDGMRQKHTPPAAPAAGAPKGEAPAGCRKQRPSHVVLQRALPYLNPGVFRLSSMTLLFDCHPPTLPLVFLLSFTHAELTSSADHGDHADRQAKPAVGNITSATQRAYRHH
eukprot:2137828-Rhodomonas_salina.1